MAGGRTKHNPKKPWGDVYERAISPAWKAAYWYNNLEVPAIMLKTGIAKIGSCIDQDALVAASAHEHVATQHMEDNFSGHAAVSPDDYEPPTKKPRPNKPQPGAPKPAHQKAPSGTTHARKIVEGEYVSNNVGVALRGGFRTGKCTQTKNDRCSHNAKKAHQCNKCLRNVHGGKGCDSVPGDKPKKNRQHAGGKGSKGKARKREKPGMPPPMETRGQLTTERTRRTDPLRMLNTLLRIRFCKMRTRFGNMLYVTVPSNHQQPTSVPNASFLGLLQHQAHVRCTSTLPSPDGMSGFPPKRVSSLIAVRAAELASEAINTDTPLYMETDALEPQRPSIHRLDEFQCILTQ